MGDKRRLPAVHRTDEPKVHCGPEIARYIKKENGRTQEIIIYKDGCMKNVMTSFVHRDVYGHTIAGQRFSKAVEKEILASGFVDEIFS